MLGVKFQLIKQLDKVGIEDIPQVGGKNASLGEMIKTLGSKGIKVPSGYAVTTSAYRLFLQNTGIEDLIKSKLGNLKASDLTGLKKASEEIRKAILNTDFPQDLKLEIEKAHLEAEKRFGKDTTFAVRSSATAEDLPDASFAGQHETYLNISGIGSILKSIRMAFASLFLERAISYRINKGFDHFSVALSVGVQKMIRSDLACSGVMFTLDTESGFPNVVVINGSYGLGEMVVQGKVTPDEYLIFKKTLDKKKEKNVFKKIISKDKFSPIINKKIGAKMTKMIYGEKGAETKIINVSEKDRNKFVLTDEEILQLAKWGVEIEKHYTNIHKKWTPMDIEWAKDGIDGKLYIVQSRPETIHSSEDHSKVVEYNLLEKSVEIIRGASVGSRISSGSARVILTPEHIKDFKPGEILITEITDPDWEPIMKKAAGIVTDKGGRTSHAAIVSRELGIPAVVGCGNVTKFIRTGDKITIDTTGSDGVVYKGLLKFEMREEKISNIPKPKTKIMMNIAIAETAFEYSFLPNSGVGLAREEFIIASSIGIHPNALINYKDLKSDLKNKIDEKTRGYEDKIKYYVDNLSYGIAKIAAAFYPHEVILRFSDFKTNEYKTLLGGDLYEPKEENPMLGFRGASRYYSPEFKKAFMLEIEAVKKVIFEMGLINVSLLIPFCRTAEEGQKVVGLIEESNLRKIAKVYVMCEIPSNVILAEQFLDIFDGMSIGSNDLTQLTLGIDRDGNDKIRSIANENNDAVKHLISQVIKVCKKRRKYIGICGQAPSDYPDFAAFLVKEGIDSISLNPDSVVKTTIAIYNQEKGLR